MTSCEFSILTAASTAVDAVPALFVLFRRSADDSKVITTRRVAMAAAATAAVFATKVLVLGVVGVINVFGVMNLLYVHLTVLMPLAGISVLISDRRSRTNPARWPSVTRNARRLTTLALLAIPVSVYASYVEPFRLQLETQTIGIPPERVGHAAIRIGVLADLQTDHVSDYERDAVDRLMAVSPHIVLIPGDLFQGNSETLERELPALRALMSRIRPPGGAYFVLGNADQRSTIERILDGTGVTLLVNRSVTVSVEDRRITIAGVELDDTPAAADTVHRLETASGVCDVRILLAHYPRHVLTLPANCRTDLVVAGHTHGGQVSAPFLGPIITFSPLPRRIAAGGLHTLDGRALYISRGVGLERGQAPRIRFLCPPEISLLTLTDRDQAVGESSERPNKTRKRSPTG